jgi:hypothetical protein
MKKIVDTKLRRLLGPSFVGDTRLPPAFKKMVDEAAARVFACVVDGIHTIDDIPSYERFLDWIYEELVGNGCKSSSVGTDKMKEDRKTSYERLMEAWPLLRIEDEASSKLLAESIEEYFWQDHLDEMLDEYWSQLNDDENWERTKATCY